MYENVCLPRPLVNLKMLWPKAQMVSNPRNTHGYRDENNKPSRATSFPLLFLAHYLTCMTVGSVSKIAHTWPERETQYVTTFLHQMLTAKLIKFPVNPYETSHAPELNRCHFNFRSRPSLGRRHGLQSHAHLTLQTHKPTEPHASDFAGLT